MILVKTRKIPIPHRQHGSCNFSYQCPPWLIEKIKILALTLLFMAAPTHAQEGCCQLSESSCRGLVTKTYCERELKGMFQEGVACRSDTGKCGVVADDEVPLPLVIALSLVFLALLGFLATIFFFAKRTRKSMNTKF